MAIAPSPGRSRCMRPARHLARALRPQGLRDRAGAATTQAADFAWPSRSAISAPNFAAQAECASRGPGTAGTDTPGAVTLAVPLVAPFATRDSPPTRGLYSAPASAFSMLRGGAGFA